LTRTLADLRSPEAQGDLLVVPLGSTEQHGPHLPVSTDTDVAVALAGRVPGAVVAPALPYGSSGEHAGFPGTLSIGQAALEHVLVELVRSADAYPRVLLLNAHGGNHDPVRRAVATLRAEGRDVQSWSPTWRGDAHAGRTETSLMLHVEPDGVRGDRAVAGETAPVGSLLPRLRREGVRAVAALEALGDPAGASARALALAAEQVYVPDPDGWGRDCDTWEDLADARSRREEPDA